MTTVSIVIPTRERLPYLEVALASVASAAAAAQADVVVVDDAGASKAARALVTRHGARYEPHDSPRGLNAARNTAIARTDSELVAFLDDDIEADPGWLAALLAAADAHPDVDVFTGPIRARLEGHPPRSCGRERPPITTLDLGDQDRDAEFAWGANMAIRRAALQRSGPFDETLPVGGDEQEWQERLRAREPGARFLYVAGAGVTHRRAGADARLRALSRAQRGRGRAARAFDARRGVAPGIGAELMTLAGCLGHVLRRTCPAGLTMAAHSLGRVEQALAERRAGEANGTGKADRASRARDGSAAGPAHDGPADDFLSGASGTVGGVDGLLRGVTDGLVDAGEVLSGRRRRLRAAARREPVRRGVLALSVVRPQHDALAAAAAAELRRTRHALDLFTCAPAGRGKFENLNMLLREHDPAGYDWLLVVDDDVVLPRGFLDGFVFLCERFGLALAQPAHHLRSHAAWAVTRRRRGSVVRETSFVEIGPVTAFARTTFDALLPFPDLRMGWGLDSHWGAVARAHGWRCGVVDAVAISHRSAPAAAAYGHAPAIAEAREFLAGRPYVPASEAERTLATHRDW